MSVPDTCGGVHPIKGTSVGIGISASQRICCVCEKDDAQHFCIENDSYIHARCALEFLRTKQGQVIIEHGHTVRLDFRAEILE
jgi:hypothetical protein